MLSKTEIRSQKSEVRIIRKKKLSFIFCLLFSVSCLMLFACTSSSTKEKPPFEYMPNMVDTASVKAQEKPMRVPPEGTLPQNFEPYPYSKDQGDEAGIALQNPLRRTKENFVRGEKVYGTYCIVCHGPKGLGDGTIVPKFPRPPSLVSEKVRNWSDGRVFHVVTKGQNLMPSYATQIKVEDRWAAILYLRALQRAAYPTVDDIEVLKKELKEGKVQ